MIFYFEQRSSSLQENLLRKPFLFIARHVGALLILMLSLLSCNPAVGAPIMSILKWR